MLAMIISYLSAWQPIAYAIIFFGMWIEGDALLFLAGFLLHQEIFDFIPLLVVVVSGVLIGDNLWYQLGGWLKCHSSNSFYRWTERLTKPFDQHLIERPLKTIFFSKFTYGLNHLILVRAGALGIKWKKLEESDLLATCVWIMIVGGLGYLSSASLQSFRHYLRFGELALALGAVAFVVIEYWISKNSRKKL